MTRDEIKERYGEVLFGVTVELARRKITIGDLLKYENGTIIKLDKTSGEPIDFLVNQRPLAYGEIQVVEDKFSIRISEILTKEQLVEKFKEGLYG